MNNREQVVGSSDTASGETHAFLFAAAIGMVDLGTLGRSVRSSGRPPAG